VYKQITSKWHLANCILFKFNHVQLKYRSHSEGFSSPEIKSRTLTVSPKSNVRGWILLIALLNILYPVK